MKNFFKKLSALMIVLTIVLSFVACGNSPKHEAAKPDKDPKKIVQDKNYTKDLTKDKKVKDGQVYIQNNTVVCIMIIKDDVKEADAKELLNKYAKELKKSYKDIPVNAQAVLKGKNIGNVVLK
ncbi:hypothetical protein [Clostridium botulinum]|uniref:Putative lipoprotein n=1 Tax=Clostridium botulinum (strain Langeland / NCTC 10281 / Type F) TaxID=441772 RepID=A7GAD8_CLOBL|nr:hypothetical protein [Clostridium botulinum]ABS41505.1 putative lipoprotein [Clostridium botulinum F str. Langeland]ADF98214.1 putative lipoprotein [Clostridium botulinum F str. 230613]KKM41429.1 hypothetical protein VT72_09210 [Clostridium botulinum]MBY6794467.1 hypothetical protein [Clostridium botulinum]MBY6938255.1 hypothetical protein [Clostridium botulinum]